MRIGFGYDSHRFEKGRTLMLAGIMIPDEPGLSGYSDGDAVAHAVADALLGAAASGDIGQHFPSGDPRWEGVDSMDLLARVVGIIEDARYRVSNVDITVICERPKIALYAAAMRIRLAKILGLGPEAVSIKGKTDESMGWTGSGEGLAVHAVALLDETEERKPSEAV
ncbi:uncharacterized protein METZ01_LOCUS346862 [marine metagenome]|uniref:2-C-methyl-D-erythritol 2,4-cyclodiphosphate synthase n=1 Tax=marine metagenome TaxID=408172 RepID=A0A382RAG2_9ZZZZ